MDPDDLFVSAGHDMAGLPTRRANVELMERIGAGTHGAAGDAEATLALAEQVVSDLTAFGTAGGGELHPSEMRVAIRALKLACRRLGVTLTIPFQDYDTFKNYWVKNGARGSWQARRALIGSLFEEPLEQLGRLASGTSPEVHEVALSALEDSGAIRDHLSRLGRSVDTDPRLAVSVAKDLIESTAKLVLRECGETFGKEDLPALTHRAQEALALTKGSLKDGPAASMAGLGKLLGSLSGLIQGVAELRNEVGVGHGRDTVPDWVQPRHARLAAGAATTWCNLMLETLGDPQAPWRRRTSLEGEN